MFGHMLQDFILLLIQLRMKSCISCYYDFGIRKTDTIVTSVLEKKTKKTNQSPGALKV